MYERYRAANAAVLINKYAKSLPVAPADVGAGSACRISVKHDQANERYRAANAVVLINKYAKSLPVAPAEIAAGRTGRRGCRLSLPEIDKPTGVWYY